MGRERTGKTVIYHAVKHEQAVQKTRMRSLVSRMFGDDPEPAVARLVEAVETYDPELLDRLAKEIAAKRRSRRGS